MRLMRPLSAWDIGKGLKGKRVGTRENIGQWQGYRLDGSAWRCKCPLCGGVLMVEDVIAKEIRFDCFGGCSRDEVAAEIMEEELYA